MTVPLVFNYRNAPVALIKGLSEEKRRNNPLKTKQLFQQNYDKHSMGIGTLRTTHPDAQSALRDLCEKQNYTVFGLGELHAPKKLDSNVDTTAYLTARELLPYLVRAQNVRIVGSELFGHDQNEQISTFLERRFGKPRGQLAYAQMPAFLKQVRTLRKMERKRGQPHPLQLRGIGPSLRENFLMSISPTRGLTNVLIQALNMRVVAIAESSRDLLESGGKLLFHTGIGHIRYDLPEMLGYQDVSYVNDLLAVTGIHASQFLGISLLVPEITRAHEHLSIVDEETELCKRAPPTGVHLRQDAANLYTLVFAPATSRRAAPKVTPRRTGWLRSIMARVIK